MQVISHWRAPINGPAQLAIEMFAVEFHECANLCRQWVWLTGSECLRWSMPSWFSEQMHWFNYHGSRCASQKCISIVWNIRIPGSFDWPDDKRKRLEKHCPRPFWWARICASNSLTWLILLNQIFTWLENGSASVFALYHISSYPRSESIIDVC